jgi:phosphate-selective porin OprO and OprP
MQIRHSAALPLTQGAKALAHGISGKTDHALFKVARPYSRVLVAFLLVLSFGLSWQFTAADDSVSSAPPTDNDDSMQDEEEDSKQAYDRFLAQLPPTPESDPPTDDDLMRRRISALEDELARVKNRLSMPALGFGTLNPNAQRSDDVSPNIYAPPPSMAPSTPTPGRVFPSVRLTGFFQVDAAAFTQDTANYRQFGQIQNDVGFRRARLAAVGDVSENVSYMVEMDFAFGGRPSFMDVWADVQKIPVLGNVKVGQWRQPFGMDELTSVRELTFLERPLMFAMAPFRQTGIGFHDMNDDKTVTWAGSLFAFPTDAWGDAFGNKGGGTAERLTATPWYQDDGRQVLHVGFDHSLNVAGPAGSGYRNTNTYGGPFGNASSASYSDTVPGGSNGATTDVPFFVNTNPLIYNYANLFDLELAGVYNSFHWQSELRYSFMEGVSPNGGTATHAGNIVMPAFYVRGAYLLTGEVRPYNKVNGVLGRIKPLKNFNQNGGTGAWEIAAQYDYIDLNAAAPYSKPAAGFLGTAAPAGVSPVIAGGGGMSNVTLGTNWYLNEFTKLQVMYMIGELDRGGVSSTVNCTCARVQLDF